MLEREIPKFDVDVFFKKKNKYALVIPTWNEGDRIRNELNRIKKVGVDKEIDIFLMDGGTTDGSTDEAFLKEVGVRGIFTVHARGQGSAYRAGLSYVLDEGYEGVVSVDGNDKESVEQIPDFIKELDAGYDFVQGSRFLKKGGHKNTPIMRLLGIKLVLNPVISFCAGFKYTETASAFRGMSRRLLENEELDIFRDVFQSWEILWHISAKAPRLGFKVKEIPTKRFYPDNKEIPTKITMSGNFRIIAQMFNLLIGTYESKRSKKK